MNVLNHNDFPILHGCRAYKVMTVLDQDFNNEYKLVIRYNNYTEQLYRGASERLFEVPTRGSIVYYIDFDDLYRDISENGSDAINKILQRIHNDPLFVMVIVFNVENNAENQHILTIVYNSIASFRSTIQRAQLAYNSYVLTELDICKVYNPQFQGETDNLSELIDELTRFNNQRFKRLIAELKNVL